MVANTNGQSMVQVLVSIGIVAILAGVMAQVTVDQSKQIRAIETKQEAIDFRNVLTMTMMSSSGCCPIGNSSVADFTMQEGSVADISVNSIFSFCPNATTPNPPKLLQTGNDNDFKYFRVKNLSIININRPDPTGAPSQYQANLRVDIENKDPKGRALSALVFPISFGTSAAEPPPGLKRKVASCSTVNATGVASPSSSGGGIPQGMQVYSTPGSYTFKVPDNVTRLKVEAWGGGGMSPNVTKSDGDGGSVPANPGGSSGAYSGDIIEVTPGTSISVVVGRGGKGTFGSGNTASEPSRVGALVAGAGSSSGAIAKGAGAFGVDGSGPASVSTPGTAGAPTCVPGSQAQAPFAGLSWGFGGAACTGGSDGNGGDGRVVITW